MDELVISVIINKNGNNNSAKQQATYWWHKLMFDTCFSIGWLGLEDACKILLSIVGVEPKVQAG